MWCDVVWCGVVWCTQQSSPVRSNVNCHPYVGRVCLEYHPTLPMSRVFYYWGVVLFCVGIVVCCLCLCLCCWIIDFRRPRSLSLSLSLSLSPLFALCMHACTHAGQGRAGQGSRAGHLALYLWITRIFICICTYIYIKVYNIIYNHVNLWGYTFLLLSSLSTYSPRNAYLHNHARQKKKKIARGDWLIDWLIDVIIIASHI